LHPVAMALTLFPSSSRKRLVCGSPTLAALPGPRGFLLTVPRLSSVSSACASSFGALFLCLSPHAISPFNSIFCSYSISPYPSRSGYFPQHFVFGFGVFSPRPSTRSCQLGLPPVTFSVLSSEHNRVKQSSSIAALRGVSILFPRASPLAVSC